METKSGLADPGIKQGDTDSKRGKGTKRKADEAMLQAKSKKPKKTKKVSSLFTLASNAFAKRLYVRLLSEDPESLLKSINNSMPSDVLVEAYSVLIKQISKDKVTLRERLWDANTETVKMKYENDKLKEDVHQLLNDSYDIDQLLG
jgi:hypothetical protein